MSTPIYAGHLCATHVGEEIEVRTIRGVLHKVIHEQDRLRVRCVVYERGTQRDDGTIRKIAHLLDLQPREVVSVAP